MTQNDKCINYIEFQVSDIATAKSFYGKAFGWTFIDYGPTYCEFNDGNMKGGFEVSENFVTAGGPLVVLYGDDLATLQKSVVDAGGIVSKPIFNFPGGRRFHFKDPQGYELAIWCEN
ncbi:MAG: putative enzyme related to lactoylglutathione lyase [Paracoccaceae bacterium]|jgi:predicted enzyme related to lactoylglutathione lyase